MPLNLLLFALLIGFLLAFIQVGLLTIAFDKLGLSQASAFLLLFSSLAGSVINLPLFTLRAEPPRTDRPQLGRFWPFPEPGIPQETIIAINVGGGLIPIAFSLYLIHHNPLALGQILLATALVTAVSYTISRPIPNMGIGMPILVAPIVAAMVAVSLAPESASAPLAYICGTLGVLIGADLLRLKDIRKLGAPIASIGGAGTFDGIFLTGIVAVLLA